MVTDTVMPAKPGTRDGFRGDIQGLRAILMIQVLLFHAWTIGSPIGVDAFILVSAYLMTSSFVRRVEAGRMPRVPDRWARTFKRLLPPLVTVVLATLAGCFFFLESGRWREMVVQAFASITYWENWRLVHVAADYYADDGALASPFQHLWSMSMQGQIFVIWPVLMALCAFLARRLGIGVRGVVVAGFGLVAVFSLGWLLLQTPGDASVYFDTRARIWEFALGSMIAAAAPWLRLPPRASEVASVAGLAVLVTFCLVPIGTYPGPVAAVPMAAASTILLYAPVAQHGLTRRFLSWRPLVALGDVSYSVYLIHWPIFVFFLSGTGQSQLGFLAGTVLSVASIALAFLLTRAVDLPSQNAVWANESTRRRYLFIALWLAVGMVPIAASWVYVTEREQKLVGSLELEEQAAAESWTPPSSGPGSLDFPGAHVLLGDSLAGFAQDPIPDPGLPRHFATWDGDCTDWAQKHLGQEQNTSCTRYGQVEGADAKVLIAGNSHTQQLLVPQVEPLLASQGWTAEAVLRGACSWGHPAAYTGECDQHNAALLEYVDLYQPDYVFLMVTRTATDSPDEVLIPGVEELIEELTSKGIVVVGLTDNLRSESNLMLCSDQREPDQPYGGCLLEEDQYFGPVEIASPLTAYPGFHLVDMRDAYCVDGVCPTIIGNIYVYLDKNHVTVPYSQTVAPYFSQRVTDALGLDQ